MLEVDSDSDMVEEEVVELLEYMVEEEKVVMGEEEVAVGEEEEELMCYSYKEVVVQHYHACGTKQLRNFSGMQLELKSITKI